ncbi:MAG TPA: YceI family protein [Acidimicrobiales bacterium]|nr:YceI family protein [Acidimicrobiales bacterium]
MSTTTEARPEIATGTWQIDPSHSDVSFTVRHLVVSKVRGQFSTFSGTIDIAENPLDSSVVAGIDLASVDTRDAKRDEHLRGADFFDVENHPSMDFRSTAVRPTGDGYAVDGELTIRGVSRPVTLVLEFNGVASDPWGGTRAGFSASTEISRKDFGISFDIPVANGPAVVGDKIQINLEVEAVKQ